MATDDLAIQGAILSPAMVLASNILGLVPEGV